MPDKPNLLFLMPDQLRPDFLSCYGADFIDTPNMDRLAEQGVRYENAYSPSPLCVPARSLLLTGRNPIKNGVLGNGQFLRPDLSECGMHTWPEYLNGCGYTTAAIGKMHFYPWDASMGFRHRVICEDKRWIKIEDDYQKYLEANGYRKLHGNEHEGYYQNKGAVVSRLPKEYYWDHFVGAEAGKYIRNHSDEKPFAIMVGFPGPHCPYDPPPEYQALFNPADMPDPIPEAEGQPSGFRESNIRGNKSDWNGVDYTVFTTAQKKKIRAHYAGLVKLIDDEIGCILDALDETGRLDNTVIVLCSDHGDYLGDHGLIGKGTFYESSTRVPLLVRTPWSDCGNVYRGPASIADITATLLNFGGCDIPACFDSRPLPELGIPNSTPRDRVYGFLTGACMHFDGEWKLAKYASGDVMLFNVREDPGEQHNRIDDADCQKIARRLDAELTAEMLRSINLANAEKLVGTSWADERFAERGWQRTYPQPIKRP